MTVDVQERTGCAKEKRRKLILDAARCLFLDAGFESATMDDVAERSQLSKATLYLYFRGKEDIYVALLHEGLDTLNAALRSAAAEPLPAPDRIAAIGRAYGAFYREQPALFRLLAHFHSRQDRLSEDVAQPCEERMMEGMRILAAVVSDGLREGTLTSPYPVMEVAAMFWASSYGVARLLAYNSCHDCLGLGPELDTVSAVEHTWGLLLRGLLAGAAPDGTAAP